MKTSSRVQPQAKIPLKFKPRRGLDKRGLELFRLVEDSYCRLFLMCFDLTAPVTAGEIAKENGRREAFLEALALLYPLRKYELGKLSGQDGWLENIKDAIRRSEEEDDRRSKK